MNIQPTPHTRSTPLTGTRITPPVDFPVRWPRPEDTQYHWTRDREHNPQPVTPMFDSVAALTAAAGRRPTVEYYDEAIVERRDCIINHYNYTRLIPFQGTPEEVAARQARNRQKLTAACDSLQESWEQKWRPELEAHWAVWKAFNLQEASLPALILHLEETIQRMIRVYEIHYLMGPPMWFAIEEFANFYCDLFPGATALDAQILLQGFDNCTLRIGRSLWRLSRMASGLPRVKKALQDLPPHLCMQTLQEDAGSDCQAFLAELQKFLSTYGRRSDLWDWGYPSWEDDPTPVINHLKVYLGQPDRDLEADLRQAASRRELALFQIRQALSLYPRPVVERFEKLLRAAQTALVLSEDHTYYIDFNGFGWAHRVILECGRRLAHQGRLRQAQDVFYISIQELKSMLLDSNLELSATAAGRRSESQRWAQYPEPRELGTRPAQPVYLYSPDARRMMRYIGGYVAYDASHPAPLVKNGQPGQLSGQPGSSGKVRGRARVILSLTEAHRMQAGDILVTTTTAPPWTPLFLVAAALVTDAGGLLSHGAVVCREYHLPAVVGALDATRRIKDGQMIEVDGDRGIVTIIDEK